MSATFMEDNAVLPTPTYCDLAVQVKAVIRQAGVATTDLECEVHGQSLALYGRVGSFYEKQVAQESIRKTFGILEVSNQLRVRS
ncbi:MAG: BON domain-containing protein [Fuerstiella sp.]